MSRLDHHVSTIQNRLALALFLDALAWVAMGLGAVVLIAILAERVLDRQIAHALIFLAAGAGLTLLGTFIYSLIVRPTADQAAMKIDEVLGLKEKFSTALYARSLSDPFAQASVRDAERTAEEVSLYKRFPLAFPKKWFGTAAVFLAALLVAELMPPMHLFSKKALAQNKLLTSSIQPHQDQYIKQELPTILAPATMPSAGEQLRLATAELNKAMNTDEGDELRNHRSVLSALEDYNKSMVEELKKNEKFQTVMEEQDQLASMASAKDDSTPIGKAQNELKSGNMDAAMNDISAAVNNFSKMSDADQKKMVDQAMALAKELSNTANNPQTMQKVAQQLMQMGASQSQAQQMAAAMQQAAQGNPQAQQQMQQMAKQIAQQMNNGQGPSQQQQQQIQSMMTKMQAMMNSQAQAQALSSATQQLGLAMAQAHAAQQQQSPSGQQSKPGQSQSGQAGHSNQGMAQAQQNLQQQLQQMQANAQDAQAMQAAANAAADSAAEAASGLNGPKGGNSDGSDASGGTSDKNGNGAGGLARGGQASWSPTPGKGGAKMGIAMAPATFKQELDPSVDNPNGKILASRYVKAGIDPGKSTAGLRDAALSAEKDAADDIDQDRVPREAQQAEKDYFSALQAQDGN